MPSCLAPCLLACQHYHVPTGRRGVFNKCAGQAGRINLSLESTEHRTPGQGCASASAVAWSSAQLRAS
eukprot:11542578-Alexandrium_andersonii.AAC.1